MEFSPISVFDFADDENTPRASTPIAYSSTRTSTGRIFQEFRSLMKEHVSPLYQAQ